AEPGDHGVHVQVVGHGPNPTGGGPPSGRTVRAMGETSTTDLARAAADLDEHGYCLIEGALSPDRVAALRGHLEELAAQEIADGTDYVYEEGANQRIWTLLNKGEMFAELALEPLVMRLIGHMLGPEFLLSNIDANIAGPGGNPMFIHADQGFVTPPWPPYAM